MQVSTVESLRRIVADAISPGIDLHRASRSEVNGYIPPNGPPTEEEIDDFLFHNLLLDEETLVHLTDPQLNGFHLRYDATDNWLEEFRGQIGQWADNQSWLGADETLRSFLPPDEPNDSQIWTPTQPVAPAWLANAPSYVLLAADLLGNGRLLSELPWRDFENLIGALLESEGWEVEVTQCTRDGGIDVVATKCEPVLGVLRSVWQAKKYKSSNKVKLHEVRELSAVRDDVKATKGFIVTTSSLTRDAVAWVKRDLYRLGYKEHDQIKAWFERSFLR